MKTPAMNHHERMRALSSVKSLSGLARASRAPSSVATASRPMMPTKT